MPFAFGDNITTDQVNYFGNDPYAGWSKGRYRGQTVAVGALPPNKWGIHEMHGNVFEWCADWLGAYDLSKTVNPKGADDGQYRGRRGGSWNYHARHCRSAYRGWFVPGNRGDFLGFRLAAVQPGEPGR
jgi:sulfatase modifying factor 1